MCCVVLDESRLGRFCETIWFPVGSLLNISYVLALNGLSLCTIDPLVLTLLCLIRPGPACAGPKGQNRWGMSHVGPQRQLHLLSLQAEYQVPAAWDRSGGPCPLVPSLRRRVLPKFVLRVVASDGLSDMHRYLSHPWVQNLALS